MSPARGWCRCLCWFERSGTDSWQKAVSWVLRHKASNLRSGLFEPFLKLIPFWLLWETWCWAGWGSDQFQCSCSHFTSSFPLESLLPSCLHTEQSMKQPPRPEHCLVAAKWHLWCVTSQLRCTSRYLGIPGSLRLISKYFLSLGSYWIVGQSLCDPNYLSVCWFDL